MAEMSLSRASAVLAAFVWGTLSLFACSSTSSSEKKQEEVQKLRARALYEQGLRSLADHQISPAMASLKEAAQIDPDSSNIHNVLGVVYLELRQPADAEAEFRRAVELDPGYGEAVHN